ncbi:MAG: AraC family transcriptional regulator [Lachnospiraceae bacterium]
MKKAQSMIHEFYADGITLSEIADRLNLTQEYMGTQFHKELGENFSAYIRNYRLAKAKELLIGTQLKQYEIAEKVGYTDAKYFARVFKECVGMSPAEYRKSNR